MRVSAAISLSSPLETLAGDYRQATGAMVELNLAGSSTLAAQIIAGALVDLFISADQLQMDRVAAQGLIQTDTAVVLLSNQLAVVVPADVTTTVTSLAMLRDPRFRRIAIGDPAGVPAGVYARGYLMSIGLWAPLRDRMVPTRSVRAALATVEAGEADAAIVYRTDAVSSNRVTPVHVVPVANGPVIAYPAAVTTHAPSVLATQRFLAYLQRSRARAVFEQAGFIVPEEQG